jgi:prepilin-type N-terminal cleavage/methylation domain-containing protein
MKVNFCKILDNKGLTLAELMMAIVISTIVLAAITSLYITTDKVFKKTKDVSDVKETTKGVMAQLEWIFQRWGASTPCLNTDPTQCTRVDIACNAGGTFTYPPQSSMCITINDSHPCDEVYFYANLYGNGFVHIPTIESPIRMNIKSCRLSTVSRHNCYHIKRGAKFIRDSNGIPYIFSLSGLNNNNLACIDGTLDPNGQIDPTATAYSSNQGYTYNPSNYTYSFEGGEIILRVPHRIRLYCQNNSQDNNTLWLYMEATDMATECNADEAPQPLVPVNSFQASTEGQGIRIQIDIRGNNGNRMTVERVYGR